MPIRLKRLHDQVVVVTGASSGIGLATATDAATRGAKVVLVARNGRALAAAVEGIAARGGDAMFVVADVASRDALEAVARATIARYGRIDTWVNNAGVGILATLENTRADDMRQLFETNFWGCVHGSMTALPYLRRQGGALINVGSLESERAVPLQGIYSASKYAVKGFTEALRVELAHEKAPVVVTLIKPGAIGTPLIQHLRNETGAEARLPPPIYAPEDAAATILDAAEHPTRDAYVGGFAALSSKVATLFPALVDWISAKALVAIQQGPQPATPTDNLYGPRSEAKVRGDTQGSAIRRSAYTRVRLNPDVSLALVALGAAGVVAFVSRGRMGRGRG